jgi:hypothetical protein
VDLALAVARHYGWTPAGIPSPAALRRKGPFVIE